MRFEQSTTIAAPVEAVWPLLADTDHLNRELGLPPILFTFAPRASGGSEVTAAIRFAGRTLRYREHPFEWVRPYWHRMRRTFSGGPFREITGGTILEAVDGGTKVTVWAEIEPSGAAGKMLTRVMGPKLIGDAINVCPQFEAYLLERASTPYPRHSARPPADRERLRQAEERLLSSGADREVVSRLAAMIAGASPRDLALIRPFALADRWGLSRRTVLETCLMAAQQGMLELRWRVLCPACRGGPASAETLGDLGAQVNCKSCNITYGPAFDRSVEVCFRTAPALRRVSEDTHCVGGPGLTPHIAAQWVLLPGESRSETPRLEAGDYRLVSLQCREKVEVRVVTECTTGGPIQVDLIPDEGAIDLKVSAVEAVPEAEWRWSNRSGETVVVQLETPTWTTDTVTAAYITSLQAFRDQFGSQVLAPGTELAVRQICILFSDLKGSTAMYRERGDAPSYQAVRDHFGWMRSIIAEHEGALVKTIGDAVMATFSDPVDGLQAALRMQREAPDQPGGLILKLGLHYGPAIAVNANGLLDYFGQTVNLAARLQRQSQGSDVILTQELASDARMAQLLSEQSKVEALHAELAGIGGAVPLLRVHV